MSGKSDGLVGRKMRIDREVSRVAGEATFRTIVVAARSAFAAIAFISVLDRDFKLLGLLHDGVQYWKWFLYHAFDFLGMPVHPSLLAHMAFVVITSSLVAADMATHWTRVGVRFDGKSVRAMVAAALLCVAALLVWISSKEFTAAGLARSAVGEGPSSDPVKFICQHNRGSEVDDMRQLVERVCPILEWRKACASGAIFESPEGLKELEDRSGLTIPGRSVTEKCNAANRMAQSASYRQDLQNLRGAVGRLSIRNDWEAVDLRSAQVWASVGIALVASFVASPLMFVWLMSFVTVFLGINELAIWIGKTLP